MAKIKGRYLTRRDLASSYALSASNYDETIKRLEGDFPDSQLPFAHRVEFCAACKQASKRCVDHLHWNPDQALGYLVRLCSRCKHRIDLFGKPGVKLHKIVDEHLARMTHADAYWRARGGLPEGTRTEFVSSRTPRV